MADQDGFENDRRNFLKCMAWVGTGAAWAMSGGVLKGTPLGLLGQAPHQMGRGSGLAALRFVQISDSHIGFNKEANHDVTATLREVAQRIASSPERPAFVIHTGDLTHLSTDEQFDTVDQVLREIGLPVFYVPGEHDVLSDDGRTYRSRFAKNAQGSGWYSFDHGGVHFIGLVNVVNLKAGGLGTLGDEQLEWLERDLKSRSASTPIVVFAHIPLWSVYPEWGWGTDDSARALTYLKRFGSVSVLNGHIHQVMQKVEGHVTFHTAMSTAFPQPAPGTALSPGPMTVEPARLKQLLGLSSVAMLGVNHRIAITDVPLASAAATSAGAEAVTIDNFNFSPQSLSIPKGSTVTWTNHDDVPHVIMSTTKVFKSPVLDTDGRYSHAFDAAGTFDYYCSLHPRMTGKVVVA